MSPPPSRGVRRLQPMRGWAAILLGIVTAYLVLERSHAEEVGTGSRVITEIVRGDRPLSPLTWLAFGVLALVLVLSGRDRVIVPVEAHPGR